MKYRVQCRLSVICLLVRNTQLLTTYHSPDTSKNKLQYYFIYGEVSWIQFVSLINHTHNGMNAKVVLPVRAALRKSFFCLRLVLGWSWVCPGFVFICPFGQEKDLQRAAPSESTILSNEHCGLVDQTTTLLWMVITRHDSHHMGFSRLGYVELVVFLSMG
mgnify:CR=1 FL=1